MNSAQIHLLLNHFPILMPIAGLLILLLGYALKSALVRRVAMALFVFGSVTAIPAFLSGEEAEDMVEDRKEVSHKQIHAHEEDAELFILFSHALGIISLLGIYTSWKKKKVAGVIQIVVLLVSLAAIGMGSLAGHSGGLISHPELNSQSSIPSPTNSHDND